MKVTCALFLFAICGLTALANGQKSEYLVGLGKADITGPVVDINLMGYANPSQIAGGIHTRLFARAIIMADALNPANRTVFVNLDACMAAQAVTFSVIKNLKARYGPDLYTEQNVALSGTHTHSGPAGYLQYLVYDITGLGFIQETFDALVAGIERAIVRAHDNLQPGQLSIAMGELLNANINRSPTAYLHNPEEERKKYQYNIDKEMTVLAAEDSTGTPLGAFSWFPVHGTSMNNTNRLVNGDNKGAAAQQMERWAARHLENSNQSTNFIAAFCQANVGDTSPNTLGPICMDTGEPCDAVHSTCGGRVEQCIGRGPAWPNHMASTKIIGMKQSTKAQELLFSVEEDNSAPVTDSSTGSTSTGSTSTQSDSEKKSSTTTTTTTFRQELEHLSGPIESRHMFLDMRNIIIEETPFTPRGGRTCIPAMGFAFAAGTTDGPGAFDFHQSDTNGTLFWRLVRDFIHTPTKEQEECHFPKPILLDVGEMHYPYEWVPYIVEIQILRVGQLVILAVPGEFTTMAGRRLKEAVRDIVGKAWRGNAGNGGGGGDDDDFKNNNENEVHIVIAGLSNTYSSYITTFEEYSAQRYEGGFTLFGPHTLDAYIQEFRKLATAMVNGKSTPSGPSPPDQLAQQWSLVPGVVADGSPNGVDFGDPVKDVEESSVFTPGEQVTVVFQSACPRNDIRSEDTYLTVERKISSSSLNLISIEEETSGGGVCGAVKRFFSKLASFFFSSSQSPPPQLSTMHENLISDNNDNENSDRWEVVHTDNDWETTFHWDRHITFSTHSFATIIWNIPSDVVPGVYRIKHYGNYKHFWGEVYPFEGSSSEFKVEVARKKEEEEEEEKKRGGGGGSSVFVRIITALGRRAGAFRA